MDLPALRYSATLNGLDSLIITKLDVLDTLDEIPVCVGYEHEGTPLQEIPPQADALAKVRPVYRNFPGWKQSTFGLTRYADLPQPARAYLEFIQEQMGIEISLISTGPEREQTIVLPGTRLERLLPSPLSHS
jgi:adenylosuccinate synthase